jgi:prepilin peptidase CpaA
MIKDLILLLPLAAVITYYDIRYRRIPNVIVVITVFFGLVANTVIGGWSGVMASISGCLLAFALMLVLHVFGALGAGDVKLFAGIGSVIGLPLVLPTFLVVLMTGGVLAIYSVLRAGTVWETAQRVALIFSTLLMNWSVPRFYAPSDRKQTIPYGVAITFGSLISLAIFRSWFGA